MKNGVYCVNLGGGQVDITSGKYVFNVTEAYKVDNGKLGAPLKGAMLIGNGPTDLKRVRMVGNDLKLDTGVAPAARMARACRSASASRRLLMDRITVGGTGMI